MINESSVGCRWVYSSLLFHWPLSSALTTPCHMTKYRWLTVKTRSWFPSLWSAVRHRSWHEASRYVSSTLQQVALLLVTLPNALSLYRRLKMLMEFSVISSFLLFFLLISAPSLGVYYCQQLTLSVCLSVTPLQIASSFVFLVGIEPFFGRQFSMWHSTKRCS